MEISSVMKKNVVFIQDNATLKEAAKIFVERHVGLLPVVDRKTRLVGDLGILDVLQLALPAFVDMVEHFEFVHDFGVVEMSEMSSQDAKTRVTKLMRPAISVPSDSKLLRALAIMRQHRLYDLPVVDEAGRLVGLASWVDVGTAFIREWTGG